MKVKQFAKALACFLLCAFLLLTGTAPVSTASAQQKRDTYKETEITSGKTLDDTAKNVLESDPSTAGAPNNNKPKEPAASYTKIFKYNSDVLFSGIYKSNSFYFNVEDYWKTSYAYARIEFSVSPLIRNVPASLTFSLNSTPVSSCKVDYGAGKTQTAYVEIPVRLLKKGFNKFTISGYVRLYDDNGCLDDLSGANWVNVSKDSLIQTGYGVIDSKNELCYYPYPFMSSIDPEGSKCALYVPANASDEELAAALLLRADLGNETNGADKIALKKLDQYGSDGIKQRVVVALRNKLPPSLSAGIKTNGHSLKDYAFVYEMSGADGNVLVITSDNAKALYEGAAMLMDKSRISQEKKSFAYVKAGSAGKVVKNSKLSDLVADKYTVEGITGGGLSFVGPFRHEQVVDLPLSGGFVLAEGGKIVLNFRYSDNLDFKHSMVTVYWGNTPVYSKKLDKEHDNGNTISFLLPSDVIGTNASSIKIAFDLELEDLYCTKRADEMPWAYVTGDSTFYLPSGKSSNYSFSTRPYPFQTLGLFKNTCAVVPDSMSSTELNTLGELIAMEGTDVSPYGSFTVARASAFDEKHTDANLILFGTYKNNKVLASLNDKLSFSYENNGNRFASNKQLLMSEDYAADIGVMQLLRSPYFSGRAILAASGANDKNIANIGSYLATEKKLWKLSGDAVLIDSSLKTKSFTFLKNEEKQKVSLRETVRQNRNAIAFTLVSTFAMLLLLLAVILVILRSRRHNKHYK